MRTIYCKLLLVSSLLITNDAFSQDTDESRNTKNQLNFENPSSECVRLIESVIEINPNNLMKQITKPHIDYTIVIENDSLYPPDSSDRQYTNGIQIKWLNNPCRQKSKWWKSFINAGFNRDGSTGSHYEIQTGGVFGANMFSPEEIAIVERQKNDRPFAGYLYGGWIAKISALPSQMRISPESDVDPEIKESMHSVELQLGVVGPAAGQEYIQSWVHYELTNSDEPLGWENQISNRATIFARYLYQKDLSKRQGVTSEQNTSFLRKNLRTLGHVGTGIGNIVNYVNLGGMVIFGRSLGEFPSLGIEPTFIKLKKDKKKLRAKQQLRYLYLGIDYRYYANNLFIEGDGLSQHNIEFIPGVYDIFAGFNVGPIKYCNDCYAGYQAIARSKEFDSSLQLDDRHFIGRISLKWRF